MRWFLFLYLAGIAVLLLGGCSAKRATAPAKPPVPSGPPVVTKAENEQIKNGMTYAEVVKIIGSEGKEVQLPPTPPNASIPARAQNVKIYKWENSDKSYTQVVFGPDGKALSITRAGLK